MLGVGVGKVIRVNRSPLESHGTQERMGLLATLQDLNTP